MILSHFSFKPLEFDQTMKYPVFPDGLKPVGFWLSDENAYGWREWCEDNDFHICDLKNRQDFECDTSRWCMISTPRELLEFHRGV